MWDAREAGSASAHTYIRGIAHDRSCSGELQTQTVVRERWPYDSGRRLERINEGDLYSHSIRLRVIEQTRSKANPPYTLLRGEAASGGK